VAADLTRLRLSIAALAVVVAGCGGGGGSTSTQASSTPAQTTGSSGATTTTTGSANHGRDEPEALSPTIAVGPKKAIPDSIRRVLQSRSPLFACEIFATSRFIQTAYGSEQGCLQARRGGGTASSVEVTAVRVNDHDAIARAIPHGGPNDGEKLTVGLVLRKPDLQLRDHGVPLGQIWQVDSLKSNIKVGP
jgi:hypothetical protein